MSVTVHLVRHGEVENPKGIIYGRLPGYNLSERGRRQAEAAADRLAKADIGALWASPLERAQETAQAIASRHPGLEIWTDDRIIESGTTVEGVGRDLLALLRSPKHWWHFRNPMGPSWGESFGDIRARMLDAIQDALRQADGKEVTIVSHQTPVLVARLALARRRVPPWLAFTPCGTGSVTTLVLEEGRVLKAAYFAPPI
ncbi:MAG: histidine phosphatase family protein [Actinomycetota bacterium]|nr:histidine phosphatase family protein [Actinomycetota bacterium]